MGVQEKYFADLYALATIILNRHGITAISGGHYCTYAQQNDFFHIEKKAKPGEMGI